ncbi:MAG: glycosyltransferase [Alphaproteobacteria bacterium]|nr:glycosyltransferase [Alphaproteobacteria bacterium]
MRIAIATDAWHPQPNGVVRVVGTVVGRLQRLGHEVLVVSPDRFRTVPCPTYAELRLAFLPARLTASLLDGFEPEAIHIATEGPIGRAARTYCLARGLPFTTAYHSKFPEFIKARTGLPLSWLYDRMRRFHAPSRAVMVPSPNVLDELTARGFAGLRLWSHGVDTEVFKPGPKNGLNGRGLDRPIFMYVGRVTIDKNLPAFLDLDLPGSKVIVGSGPARDSLMKRYPAVPFLVADGDAALARLFNAPDVFVFPSLTDTFGLVMLEALACGVPVAAFPVTGPRDVLAGSQAGCLDADLRKAALAALDIPAEACRAHALKFSWDRVVDEFLSYLAPIRRTRAA